MLSDVLTAAIIAAFFGIGALLYYFTAEEIDSFKKKFGFKPQARAKNVILVPAAILGAVQAYATKTPYLETISLLLLATALIFGSFIVAKSNKRLTLKYAAETAITFLVFFFTVYVIIALLS